jgi:hypothetical protein
VHGNQLMVGQGESKKTEGRIAATGKLRRVLDLRKSGVGFQAIGDNADSSRLLDDEEATTVIAGVNNVNRLVKATGHSPRPKAETPESLIGGFVDSAEVCAAKKATSKIAAIT